MVGLNNVPTADILWMRDGTVGEQVFATRFLAECFLALVPFTVAADGEHEVVAAAMLSRLVGSGQLVEWASDN